MASSDCWARAGAKVEITSKQATKMDIFIGFRAETRAWRRQDIALARFWTRTVARASCGRFGVRRQSEAVRTGAHASRLLLFDSRCALIASETLALQSKAPSPLRYSRRTPNDIAAV